MHHEILKDCTIRNVNFKTGQIVYEGDFPPHEFNAWIQAGNVKRHETVSTPAVKEAKQTATPEGK